MRLWTPDDYGGVAGVGTMLQHPRSGFIYVLNGARVLEFDGIRWRALPTFGAGMAGALVADANGRLWLATAGDVGCLEPDPQGELRLVSMRMQLPGDDPALTDFGAALATPAGVFFGNARRVVFFPNEGGRARVWKFDDNPLVPRLWWQDNAVHVRGREALRLVEGEFRPVSGLRTAAMIARRDPAGGWQLVTNDGIRRWEDRYRGQVTGELAGDLATCAVFLNDGRIAFGTNSKGVILCDAAGRRQQVIDRSLGLPSNRVDALCADRDGGLWVGLRNGIVRLQVDSPLARHGVGLERIETSPVALGLHRGELYVGGGEGLWRRDPAGGFHPIADVPFQVRAVVTIGDELFLTGVELRRVGADDRARRVSGSSYGLVAISTAPGHFVQGNNDGLALVRAGGDTWTSLGQHPQISGFTAVSCEWPAGVVWAINASGVWRVDFRGGVRPDAPVRQFTAADGVPPGVTANNSGLGPWSGGLSGGMATQLVRFNETSQRFEAETRIEGLPRDARGYSPISAGVTDGDELWLQVRTSAANLVHVVPTGRERWRAEPLPQPELARVRANAFLADPGRRTLWIGSPAGLVSRDLDWRPGGPAVPLPAAIRRVEAEDGTLLWADGPTLTKSEATRPALALLANQNALRVLFAAPSFAGDHQGRAHTVFRTRLAGLDTGWSGWRGQAFREFTNLPYRDFVLHVQARDDAGRESAVATLAFSIAPPWWLTRWAFAGYGVLGLLSVAGIVGWRTRALRARAARLERTVTERTSELAQSNAQLAQQNTELERLRQLELDEKISAQLEAQKTRLELLRYQLNPHFLFNSLNAIGAQTTRRPEVAREMMYALSEFCRLALHRADEGGDATVAAEIEMLKSYLAIEQARRGPDLVVTIDVAPDAAACPLPPFLLLPLVENAVKYGSRTSEDKLEIGLRARCDGSALILEVANSGRWVDPQDVAPGYGGIGLKNLRERLARHYPDAHHFTTGPKDDRVVARVLLTAPPINLATSASSQNSGPSSQPNRSGRD